MDDTTTKTNTPTAWVKLYHHCGALVSIPIETSGIASGSREWADMLFASVDNLIHAGFANDPPRLEEGEQKIATRWLVRRSKFNEDNTVTPIVDLYGDDDRLTYAVMSVYLNDAAAVEACKRATGIDVMKVLVYDGQGKLERQNNPQVMKYFTRMEQPTSIIRKKNPKYNPEEPDIKKRKPQFLFCRWADLPVESKPEEQAPTAQSAPSRPRQAQPQTTTQFGPQYIAMSAQTAGSCIGRFNAALSAEEQKQIVAGITKEVVAQMTPEDYQRVRQAHTACTNRLQESAKKHAQQTMQSAPADTPAQFEEGVHGY